MLFIRLLSLVLLFSIPTTLSAQMNEAMQLECTNPLVVRSQVRNVQAGTPNVLTTTPVNQRGEHIPDLTVGDFLITKGKKVAEIQSVEEITAVESTVMRVVFMVDNSQSMSPHLELLKETLQKTIQGFSEAVRVSVMFFREGKLAAPAFEYNGRPLPLIRLPYTKDKNRAVDYAGKLLVERNLTRNTYLYDGVYATRQLIVADTGTVDKSFAIIFSDGDDNASEVEAESALRMDAGNTVYFTIDYLTKANDFLVKVAHNTGGEHFQATNAEDLAGIFEAIASKIVAKGYTIAYGFKSPPAVSLSASTDELLMEEEIVRETFPMLPYVFFGKGSSSIPDRYARLDPQTLAQFDESAVEGGALEFYHNALNIIGSRMRQLPDATVSISGFLDNTGVEKKNATLALARAEAIGDYLKSVWGIAADRLTIDAGTLPPVPSSSRDSLGQAENRRVEITSNSWELMRPVTFVRRIASITPEDVLFKPLIEAEEGLETWMLTIEQGGTEFDRREGVQAERSIRWNWKNREGALPASSGDLQCRFLVRDKAGDSEITPGIQIRVREVRREKMQNVSVSDDGITKEKISLILFPFNVAEPGERNVRIMEDYVYPRITDSAQVLINGYTDVIGSEEYNQDLSQQRADAVHALLEGMLEGKTLKGLESVGRGEISPVFPNALPEGRFYNRTVSLLIEKYPL